MLQTFVENEIFKFTGLACVFVSCILLATYNPFRVSFGTYCFHWSMDLKKKKNALCFQADSNYTVAVNVFIDVSSPFLVTKYVLSTILPPTGLFRLRVFPCSVRYGDSKVFRGFISYSRCVCVDGFAD
jgi:hypothetical protein